MLKVFSVRVSVHCTTLYTIYVYMYGLALDEWEINEWMNCCLLACRFLC